MYCNVCGSEENIYYYFNRHQYLCPGCCKATPIKITRTRFDELYWKNDPNVPACTKKEFYSDYLTSDNNFEDYLKSTTFPIEV